MVQLGARMVWDHEVAGSIPATPTNSLLPQGMSKVSYFSLSPD